MKKKLENDNCLIAWGPGTDEELFDNSCLAFREMYSRSMTGVWSWDADS